MNPGQFTLISNYVPTLAAGDYVLHATQTVANAPGAHIDPLDANLRVVAPRYVLAPDQVLSTFPPSRASGAFSTRLPQIVLRRRTLPWERRASPTSAPDIPWLALVVLADNEPGEFKTGVPISDCVTAGTPMPGDNDAEVGDALTVPMSTVAYVFPAQDEVALLTHVRRVDLTDTELALGDDDGLLAVLVANRLPQPGRAYTAYLISLENQINRLVMSGFHQTDDQATHAPTPVGTTPITTWPVLAHWTFACVGEGDFQSLMQKLDIGLLGTVVPPKPAAPGKPPPPGRPNPPEVLATGHLGVDHTTREGDARRAWYRGPLVPFPGTRTAVGADGKLPLMHTSDQARRIGPDGRENLALATAFEIGRLLALAEPAIVAALLLWRKDGLNGARTASLLSRELALSRLHTHDVGAGFAARAGLDLLTSLGADAARRLGGIEQPAGVMAAAAAVMEAADGLSEAPDDEFALLRAAVEQAAAQLTAATEESQG